MQKGMAMLQKFLFNLSFFENEVELVIVDNGKGSEKVEYGFGLTSMQERLKALNGAFQNDFG